MKETTKFAFKASVLGAAMVAMTGLAQAAPGSFDLGAVSSTATSFSATPALPAIDTANPGALRSVDIDDTYSFTVATQSAVNATLSSASLVGMGGVVTWKLSYSLLDAQSNVVATGVLNPTPSITMGGQCQVIQGQQVNCTDKYSTYTTNLTDGDVQAGLYKLHITGTETSQIYGGTGFSYAGTVSATAVPEAGTAASLALGLLGLGCVTRRKERKAV